jgi:hypothetical protein
MEGAQKAESGMTPLETKNPAAQWLRVFSMPLVLEESCNQSIKKIYLVGFFVGQICEYFRAGCGFSLQGA